jgi:hypothetical protein
MDPILLSSDHKRIDVAGTRKTNKSGMFIKKVCISACLISKNPCLKVKYAEKKRKTTRNTYATGVVK